MLRNLHCERVGNNQRNLHITVHVGQARGLARDCELYSLGAGAVKDNGRAAVIGDANTYGKGKIQSVFELSDGSALFVTVARYKTPVRH